MQTVWPRMRPPVPPVTMSSAPQRSSAADAVGARHSIIPATIAPPLLPAIPRHLPGTARLQFRFLRPSGARPCTAGLPTRECRTPPRDHSKRQQLPPTRCPAGIRARADATLRAVKTRPAWESPKRDAGRTSILLSTNRRRGVYRRTPVRSVGWFGRRLQLPGRTRISDTGSVPCRSSDNLRSHRREGHYLRPVLRSPV